MVVGGGELDWVDDTWGNSFPRAHLRNEDGSIEMKGKHGIGWPVAYMSTKSTEMPHSLDSIKSSRYLGSSVGRSRLSTICKLSYIR